MSFWLRIGGVPATEIAAHTKPTWENLADGGTGAVTFALALSFRSQHPALRVRSLVEVMYGLMPVAAGLLTEPDRTTWACRAYGLSASLRNYLALDSAGNVTRDVADAVGQASVRGCLVTNPANLGGVATGDADTQPISVGTLLDQRAVELGQRWGVNGMRRLFLRPDPTEPTLMTAPGVAAFAPTDENAPGRLVGVYYDGTGYPTATVGTSEPEASRDLTARGTLTLAEAQAILQGELDLLGATGWVNSVTLDREQFMGIGGNPANMAANHAGKMIRAHGIMSNALGVSFSQDVVIGKTTYTAGAKTITIEPVNKAPRDVAGIIAAS
jgi:hypothetical protein